MARGGVANPSEFRERLLPRWWAWLLAYSFVGMIAIAYGAALGATIGWLDRAPAGSSWRPLLLVITAPDDRGRPTAH